MRLVRDAGPVPHVTRSPFSGPFRPPGGVTATTSPAPEKPLPVSARTADSEAPMTLRGQEGPYRPSGSPCSGVVSRSRGTPCSIRGGSGTREAPGPASSFVPTASGEAVAYPDAFRTALGRLDCAARRACSRSSRGTGTRRPCAHRSSRRTSSTGAGGSAANLLAVWRARGVGRLIREAERGALLCGISAGANCEAAASLTDSRTGHSPCSPTAWARSPARSARAQCPGPESWGSAPRPRSSNAGGADFPAPYRGIPPSVTSARRPPVPDGRAVLYTALPIVMQGIWLGGTRSGRAVLVSRDPLPPRRPRLLPCGKRRGLRGGGTGPWGLSSPWSGWGRHRWRTRPGVRREAWTSPRRGR
ncbi:Type 1 glutamine amidotransferase-like domain-containing protein [Streptomyces sp. SPB78]|uniref:Type 1 glutamine amidotransferase-like domain-containing protein n=1 Tax=Streptomyces sp. (strain SPB78) TaxID=591157 RepID=UPI0009961226